MTCEILNGGEAGWVDWLCYVREDAQTVRIDAPACLRPA